MQINKINSIQNFKGITQYQGKTENKKPNYLSIKYTYNYYPFADETKKEIEAAIKAKADVRYWDGINPKTHQRCGGVEEIVVKQQEPLKLTKDEYRKMVEEGSIDSEILSRALHSI